MEHFKTGDVVTLKSGGPNMVVDEQGAPGYVRCIWMPEDGKKVEQAFFREAVLKATSDEAPPMGCKG